MYRYLATIYKMDDPQELSTARLVATRLQSLSSSWRVVTELPGLTVLEVGERAYPHGPYTLGLAAGVILGQLFRRSSDGLFSPVVVPLPDTESTQIASTSGRQLVSHFWGNYVALIANTENGTVHVLRDPSGCLPCYSCVHKGVQIVFSHIEDVADLAFLNISINWRVMRAICAGMALQTNQTALNEVTELRAGECLTIRGDQTSRSFYWNPIDIALADRIDNVADAVSLVRHTVSACVHAWAECNPCLIHSLSGGMDSSIVAACLSTAPTQPAVTCLNYYTAYIEGDERKYARLAAHAAGYKLIEQMVDGTAVKLQDLLQASRTTAPAGYVFELLYGSTETELAHRLGATAFFQGGGGDGIFLQVGAENAPGDYIKLQGIGSQLWDITRDAARVTQRSFGWLLRRGISSALRKPRWKSHYNPRDEAAFVLPDVKELLVKEALLYTHPLLLSANTLPEGKLWHIYVTSFPPSSARAFRQFERPSSIFPLLSQPVHELCLRIPTYVLFHGGWDRAIARLAFQDRVPDAILRRRTKGMANRVLRSILDANTPFLREILLDGTLVAERVVDKRRLEAYLDNPQLGGFPECNAVICSLLDAEIFLRSWSETRYRAAA